MVTGVLDNGTTTVSAEKQFIQSLVSAGKLGKKSGEGLYVWKNGKPVKKPDAAVAYPLADLAEQLIKAYTDECQAALNEGVVSDSDLLDAGMIFGTGFAPFRGGPLYYLAHRELQPQVQDVEPEDNATTQSADEPEQETETRV